VMDGNVFVKLDSINLDIVEHVQILMSASAMTFVIILPRVQILLDHTSVDAKMVIKEMERIVKKQLRVIMVRLLVTSMRHVARRMIIHRTHARVIKDLKATVSTAQISKNVKATTLVMYMHIVSRNTGRMVAVVKMDFLVMEHSVKM